MKIALCFSGQPRQVSEGYNVSIYKNLIEPNNITDVFVHTWFRREWKNGTPYQTVNRPIWNFNKSMIEDIEKLYNPLKMEVEDDTDYHDFINENYINNENYISDEKRVILYSYPRFLSIYKSNKLKNEYEKEHGFEYDVIIKARFDLYIRDIIINIKDLDMSKFHIPVYASRPFIEDETFPTSDWGVNDQFAIGNKKNMDIYADLVNNISKIAEARHDTSCEGTTGTYLLINNVPIHKSWHSAYTSKDWKIGFLLNR